MNNKTYKQEAKRFPKCVKTYTYYTDRDGQIEVILDKNQQICGGTYFATHKGRPCTIEGKNLVSPVTAPVTVTDRNGNEKTVWLFDYYETLIEGFKVVR